MSEDYPAKLYAAVHRGNPGDVGFYRRRCAGARSIVELGCGDARVLSALAEPGRTRVGVDADPEQLGLARGRGADLELVEADMRALDPGVLGGRRFERVIVPHGGLYCLLSAEDLAAALRGAASLLTGDGLLIADAWAADGFHAEADPDDQDPSWLEPLDPIEPIEVDGERWEVLERSTWDKPRQRLDVTYVHVRVGADADEAVEGLLRQRYVLVDQLREALAAAGLAPVEIAGDFAGTPYDNDSELLVVVARRVGPPSDRRGERP